jgi:hypothetical protein
MNEPLEMQDLACIVSSEDLGLEAEFPLERKPCVVTDTTRITQLLLHNEVAF